MTTAEELAAITDRGKFEILANAILRESDSNYRALTAPGVNAAGEPVKSPVDAYCWVPAAGPPHLIVVAHTTTEAKRLRDKWFGDSGSGRNPRQSKVAPGDLPKIAEQIAAARVSAPEAECTIVLTSNERVPAPLQDRVQAFARDHNASADIWDQARLTHFLDHTFVGRGLRRRLLNRSERAAFVTHDEFFQPWLDGRALFNHTWPLQGRLRAIEEVRSFLDAPDQHIFILPGSGGIGKSRLLRRFVDEAQTVRPDLVVCFLMSGICVTPDDFVDLPDAPVLIVVDDAHQRDDLNMFLATAVRHPHPLKVIFACRPYGLEPIKSMVFEAGYQLDAVSAANPLKPLSEADTEQLAQNILQSDFPHLVRPVVQATRDCPLMTTLAAKLVAERQIAATVVTNEPKFRASVLQRFRDALLYQLGDDVSQERARQLLPVIAAASPIPTATDAFRDLAARFLQWRPDEVATCLDKLRAAGVLVHRGDALRITPDVLSDEFLQSQCMDSQGKPTGFAARIYDDLGDVSGPNLVRNLAQLDWRMRNQHGTESSLLDDTWGRITATFRAATNSERLEMLSLLKHVAHFLPKRMLELVEVAIAEPSAAVDEIGQQFGVELTHTNVLAQLPDILELIGHTIDFLSQCCQLLWSLASETGPTKDGERNLALDKLCDIAKYRVYPDRHIYLQRNAIVLEQAERWATDIKDGNEAIQFISVIENLLGASGRTDYFDGSNIVCFEFTVPLNQTVDIRHGALSLLMKLSNTSSEVVRFRIVQALHDAVRPPDSTYHNVLTTDQILAWTPERMNVLTAYDDLLDRETSPIVQLQIGDDLRWYADHDIDLAIRARTHEILRRIHDTGELDAVRNLTRAYEPGWMPPDGTHHKSAFEGHDREMLARREVSASRFLNSARSPSAAVTTLNNYLDRINDCGIRPDPEPFFAEISRQDPDFAADIAIRAVASLERPLKLYARSLISSLWRANPVRAIGICATAIRTGNARLACSMAEAMSVVSLTPEHYAERNELIRELIESKSDEVRACGISALDTVEPLSGSGAIDVVLSADFGDGSGIAEAACRFATRRFTNLSLVEIDRLLARLDDVPDIGNSDVGRFIALASHKRPRPVFDLLIRRIQSGRNFGYGAYHPVPQQGTRHRLGGIIESSEHSGLLREVRNSALGAPWAARQAYPHLFRLISAEYCKLSIDVLLEWSELRDCEKLKTIAHLMTAAPSVVIFRESVLVENLLLSAKLVSDLCLHEISVDLVDAAMGRSRSGTPGQPYPEDIAIRDRAATAIAKAAPGTATHDYYSDLFQRAERSIRDAEGRLNDEDE
jgi:hypothetical protein